MDWRKEKLLIEILEDISNHFKGFYNINYKQEKERFKLEKDFSKKRIYETISDLSNKIQKLKEMIE